MHSICNLKCKTLKETPAVLHNGTIYDYHFIINGLAEEFERQFDCPRENKEKTHNFFIAIKREIKNKKGSLKP